MLLSLTFAVRHLELGRRDGCPAPLLLAALLLGQSVVLLLLCIIAVPYHSYPHIHDAFGYSLFYAAAAYLILNCVCDHLSLERASVLVRGLRLGVVATGCLVILAYWALYGPVGTTGASRQAADPRTFWEAMLEIVCFALLLLFIGTFSLSQRGMVLSLRARRREGEPQGAPADCAPLSAADVRPRSHGDYAPLFAPAGSAFVLLSALVGYPIAASRAEPPGERLAFPDIMLSNAANYAPASCFVDVLMSAGCVLFAYAFIIRHLEVQARLPGPEASDLPLLAGVAIPSRTFPAWNTGVTCLGLVCLVATPFVVLAVPIHDAPDTHWTIAATGFYCSAAFITLQLFLDRACACSPAVEGAKAAGGWPPSRPILSLRTHIIVAASSVLFTFLIFFGPDGSSGLVGRRPWGMVGDALCELTFLLIILVYIATFFWSGSELVFTTEVTLECAAGEAGLQTPLLSTATSPAAASHGTFD